MKFIWSGWFWGFGAEILEKVNLNRRIFHHFPRAKMLHAICTFLKWSVLDLAAFLESEREQDTVQP